MKKKMKQINIILKLLLEGNSLTVRGMFGSPVYSNSPCRRIADLKEKGYPIEDRWIKTNKNKNIKEYYIDPKNIKKFMQGYYGDATVKNNLDMINKYFKTHYSLLDFDNI